MVPGNAVEESTSPAAPSTTLPDPTTGTPGQDQSGATPTSESELEQDRGTDWFRNAVNSMRGQPYVIQAEAGTPPASVSQSTPESDATDGTSGTEVQTSAEAEGDSEPAKSAPTAAKPQAKGTTDTGAKIFSEDEFNRRVQSETDRRLDKFQREEAERRKKAEEKALRDNDPYGYAQMMREREAEREQAETRMQEVITVANREIQTYDREVLDPFFMELPKKEQERILSNIEPGIPGRGKAAKETLQVLRNHYREMGKAEARKALLEDQAFVKEVLARYGGMRVEPDSNPAQAVSAVHEPDMNDIIRGAARQVRMGSR